MLPERRWCMTPLFPPPHALSCAGGAGGKPPGPPPRAGSARPLSLRPRTRSPERLHTHTRPCAAGVRDSRRPRSTRRWPSPQFCTRARMLSKQRLHSSRHAPTSTMVCQASQTTLAMPVDAHKSALRAAQPIAPDSSRRIRAYRWTGTSLVLESKRGRRFAARSRARESQLWRVSASWS